MTPGISWLFVEKYWNTLFSIKNVLQWIQACALCVSHFKTKVAAKEHLCSFINQFWAYLASWLAYLVGWLAYFYIGMACLVSLHLGWGICDMEWGIWCCLTITFNITKEWGSAFYSPFALNKLAKLRETAAGVHPECRWRSFYRIFPAL